nr:CU044_5270 family protein [Micromonospora sp. DSM 115978]
MFGERRTRELVGPADPVRHAPTAPPRLSAHDVIGLADASTKPLAGRDGGPTRRLVLVAGAAVLLVGAGAVIREAGMPDPQQSETAGSAGNELGPVLVPISYQPDSGGLTAGSQLRELAGRLEDAPYEHRAGRYTCHVIRVWGDPMMTSPDARYSFGYSSERQSWHADDGSGRQVVTQLRPEFPDQESRDYWRRHLEPTRSAGEPYEVPVPPQAIGPLPSNRAQLAELLRVRDGARPAHKQTVMVFTRFAVPRQTRAEILLILADLPGLQWRGEVTDRAGRKGLGVTFGNDGQGEQNMLIFDPKTGELLADEMLTAAADRVVRYQLFLSTDRVDRIE